MQPRNKKTWLKWLPPAVLAPIAAVVWLGPYFGSDISTSFTPSAPTMPPAAVVSSVRPVTPAKAPQTQAADVASVSPMPNLPVAGNLGVITDLRATLQEKQIRQSLHEIEVKLAGTPAPGVAVLNPDELALMVAPEKNTREPDVAAPVRPSVVSVQGVDGMLSATLRSGGKLLTLRVGQKFTGGTVIAISRDDVRIRNAHGQETLSFE